MARRFHLVNNVPVVVPKGYTDLNTRHQEALSILFSRGKVVRKGKQCPIVFFHDKAGDPVAVQRCAGRKLRAANRQQCRKGGKGPDKMMFVRCPAGRAGVKIRKGKGRSKLYFLHGARRRR